LFPAAGAAGALLGAVLLLGPVFSAAGAEVAPARLAACLACHGEKGESALPLVPSLAAQPAFYLTVQLLMFREKMRVADVMNQATQGLTDNDLRSLAAYFSKLPAPASGPPGDAARMERARALAEQSRCNFCHNRDYSGDQNVPRLAGQREDYLATALRGYKSNTRRGYDAAMADVLYSITDEQILDLAYYLARFR
jgi:cytochrome c553